jgi:hypothetical protein
MLENRCWHVFALSRPYPLAPATGNAGSTGLDGTMGMPDARTSKIGYVGRAIPGPSWTRERVSEGSLAQEQAIAKGYDSPRIS